MRGRPPTPSALKALRGDASHRPDDGRVEPTMPAGIPEPPAHLSAGARQEWYAVMKWLTQVHGLLSPTDHAAVGVYCSYYDQWQQAEQALPALRQRLDDIDAKLDQAKAKQRRAELQTQRGRALARYNLALGERNKARREMRAYLIELGLTPASRSRLRIDNGQAELALGSQVDELAAARAQLTSA